MPEAELRVMCDDDVDEVCELERAAYAAIGCPWLAMRVADVEFLLGLDTSASAVAVDCHNHVLGWINYGRRRGGGLEIGKLAVRPEWQRMRLAAGLVERAFLVCRPGSEVSVFVPFSTLPGAGHFFKALGFCRTEYRPMMDGQQDFCGMFKVRSADAASRPQYQRR
jgi:predicted N-acetyltransferase YhbS